MTLAVTVILKRSDGSVTEETEVISFHFVKDAYIPYTTFSAKLKIGNGSYLNICEVFGYVNGFLVHHGLVDTIKRTEENGLHTFSVTSRGFTSLLCQNQLEPGMYFRTSLNSLMTDYYNLPYITHEDNSDNSNYIYVKNNASMWDCVVNLSYKLTGMYPYISGTNCVRITADRESQVFTVGNDEAAAVGSSYDFRRMVSHLNMSDINGDYGNYTLDDNFVIGKKLIRHNVFELDRQYLYNPQQALEFRSKFTKRGNSRSFCRYFGYRGEDIFNFVSFGVIHDRRIARVEIIGGTSGIMTELSVYSDGFLINGTI